MEFYERLANIRRQRGITQEELADRVDVSRQTVYRWERGDAMPDIEHLNKLCEIFKVFPEYFVDPDIDPSEKSIYKTYETQSKPVESPTISLIITIVLFAISFIVSLLGFIFGFAAEGFFIAAAAIAVVGIIKTVVDIFVYRRK